MPNAAMIVSNAAIDLAFALYSDVCPRRGKAWAQPPDMTMGANLETSGLAGAAPGPGTWTVRADDFLAGEFGLDELAGYADPKKAAKSKAA